MHALHGSEPLSPWIFHSRELNWGAFPPSFGYTSIRKLRPLANIFSQILHEYCLSISTSNRTMSRHKQAFKIQRKLYIDTKNKKYINDKNSPSYFGLEILNDFQIKIQLFWWPLVSSEFICIRLLPTYCVFHVPGPRAFAVSSPAAWISLPIYLLVLIDFQVSNTNINFECQFKASVWYKTGIILKSCHQKLHNKFLKELNTVVRGINKYLFYPSLLIYVGYIPPGTCSIKILKKPSSLFDPRYLTMCGFVRRECSKISSCSGCTSLAKSINNDVR